ncbi:hypothetical protein C8D78_0532 [Arthrobacter oryzae]|uniref:Uncharacterized protein n=1 Tax=Arthrobacter oryzae TaxID=409290 RepID=A0A495FLU6_9MICC|nr:hypothetical protein C8D78_0532 [Arthrobacter oryzae]
MTDYDTFGWPRSFLGRKYLTRLCRATSYAEGDNTSSHLAFPHGYHPKAVAKARPASTNDAGTMSRRSSLLFDARLGRTLSNR